MAFHTFPVTDCRTKAKTELVDARAKLIRAAANLDQIEAGDARHFTTLATLTVDDALAHLDNVQTNGAR